MMPDEIYTLFREVLPEVVRSEETVREILGNPGNRVFAHREDGILAGVSVVGGNTIFLLCVGESYRNRGIGSALLIESERFIKANGYDSVVIGAGSDYITPGVPMNRGAHLFFQKRGYRHSWGESGCFDMEADLRLFSYIDRSIGDEIDGITCRWAVPADLVGILRCIEDADKDFTQYYRNEELYQTDSKERVLIAVQDSEVLGALMVSFGLEGDGLGSVGCTATATAHRSRGIATTLVRLGTRALKEAGFTRAWLGYTYADIVNLYGRAGYRICMEYFMAVKNL